MKTRTILLAILFIGLIKISANAQSESENWPHWRGPNMNGVLPQGNPPIEWNDSTNIKWKLPIQGKGFGTPIVWGDQIFFMSAIEIENKASISENIVQFKVYSVSLKSGEIIWEKIVREQIPHAYILMASSYASASCVTDGTNLIASFGSYGIYCFNLNGELLWERDLGDMEDPFSVGEGSSPIIHKDRVIVVWDHMGDSKIYAIELSNGNTAWVKDRSSNTTWATPIVASKNGKDQIIVPGDDRSISYDFNNGDEIWYLDGLGNSVIPSPVFDGKYIYLMGGEANLLQAIEIETAKGDINGKTHWTIDQHTPYVASPLLKESNLYFLRAGRAQISCVDTKTGTFNYTAKRPKGMFGTYSSPIAANGYIYILDNRGLCSIIKEGKEYELVNQNKIKDQFDASPIAVGDNLLLKGSKFLYCIAK